MNKFRLLHADEIECRIGSVSREGTGFSLLLYKTARTDANLLDETVGPENWVNDFKVVDGVLYGGIGIYYKDVDHWIWKWDAGTESNTEAEKGRASDAFKRAGFKHGIGRELYTSPFIWISGADTKDRFAVKTIDYDDNDNICKLVIINEKTGAEVFTYPNNNKYTPKAEPVEKPQKTSKKTDFIPTCKDCGKEIEPRVHDYSVTYYGAPYCRDCQFLHKKIK